MANKRFIVRHGLDNSGDNSVVNTITNVAEPVNNSDAATKYYVDTHTTGGTVTAVTATSPVESTGGTTPVISLGTGANGQLVIGTGTGFTKSTLTAGTGVSIANASGSITISATGSGGDVVGPASSTDNAVTRFDSTTGKLIQNSTVTLDDNGNFDNVNSVVLDNTPATLPTGAGTMYWEDGEGTAEVILKGGNTTLKVGTQEYARVYNDSGSTITLGQVVYISGAQGNRIAVKLAQANTEANSFGTLGLVAETIANGAEGWIIVSGALYKLNTNGLTAGAVVYLSPTTAGAYTTTKPQAPDQLVVLGFIERVSSTVGSIYVKVDNGYELDELHDVRITSPVSGNTLIYDATTSPTGVWKNASLTAGTGISVTNGAGSITIGNTGVTSVSGTSPVVSSGGATPAISLASGYGDTQNPYGSKTANYFLASPNGSAGVPTWRSIVAADIPTLNQNTTGTAANITATSNTTLTTLSSLVSIGTITTGTWNASAIGVAYGGTGLTTLTAGYIPYGNGTSAFGSSANLFWDSTNSRLGVGTSSPSLPLHVYNSGAALAYFESTNANGPYVIWRSSGTSIGDVGSGKGISGSGNVTDFMIASRSTYPMILGTGSTERMRIDSSGNVGIGVTPSAWYPSVYTAIDVGASSCFGGYASGASGDELTFVAGNVYFNSSNTPIYKANGFATNYRQFNGVHQWFNAPSGTAGNSITFTQAMTLDASGNLGIGTSSPSAKLQVNSSGITPLNLVGSTACQINLNDGTQNANWGLGVGGVGITGIASPSTYPLVMYTNGSERMRIDSNGNVGIGVVPSGWGGSFATTQYKGGFIGSQASGYLYTGQNTYYNGTDWKYINTAAVTMMEQSFGAFVFLRAASGTAGNNVSFSESMRIDSSGNVGIGVSSTTFRLDVQGSSSGYLEAIRFKNTNSAGYLTTSWTVGSAEATIRYAPGIFFKIGPDSGDTTSPVVFATNNGTERMRITSTEVKATVPFIGNSGTKGFGAVTTTTSTSTPTGGSSGDHYYIY